MNRSLLVIFAFWFFLPQFVFSEVPDLTGKWKLNEEESDNPREKFAEAMEREGRPVEKRRGGGGRGKEEEDRGRGMPAPSKELTISYEPPALKIIEADGKEQIYYTDGRKSQMETAGGRKVFLISRWEEDQLVIESEGPQGGKMTQSVYLSPAGDQLNVKTRVQPLMLDRPITIVRVYDRLP